MKFLYAVVAACVASSVSAHGVIDTIVLGGKTYHGPGPKEEDGPAVPDAPVRRVQANGPVTDVTSSDMACGLGVEPTAGGIANVTAGSDVTIQMTPWEHTIGPITTYLGKCPDGTSADKCDGTQIKWFKIAAQGLVDGTQPNENKWVQAQTLAASKPNTVTIPAGIASGAYLLRYEIIALHRAMSDGGAEFYPSCTQLQVTGPGTATPSGDDLVSFPGAYSASDPGILVDVYTSFSSYTYPGPPLFDGSSSGGNGSGGGEDPSTSSDPAPSTTSSDPEPTTTSSDPEPTTSSSVPEPTTTSSDPEPTTTSSDPEPTTTDPAPTTTTSSTPSPSPTTCKRKRSLPTKAKAKRVPVPVTPQSSIIKARRGHMNKAKVYRRSRNFV